MARYPPFDMGYVKNCVTEDEGLFTQEILSCADRLGASHKEKENAQALSVKLKYKLDHFMANPHLLECLKIEDVYEVGSVKTDTALAGNCVADIVVITSSLPSYETMSRLATLLMENSDVDEHISCVAKDYGVSIHGTTADARILVTITPNNISLLEPDLHLSEETMRHAYQAVRHSQWIEAVSGQGPVKELIRVVKDVRRRYAGLQPLSIWDVQYLCWFALFRKFERVPLPLGAAFRRFFQLISAGLFLPNSVDLIDPLEPATRIGHELNFEQMDTVTSTAQTICRLICNKGQAIVLGVTRLGCDVTKENTIFNDVTIKPSESVYNEDDMKPKFCEEDLELLEGISG